MAAATASTPLLPVTTTATAAASEAAPPLTRLQRGAITAFCGVRFVRGVSLLAYPKFAVLALDVEPSVATYMLASLIGVRDVLIAGLLFTADFGARLEVSRALAVNLLSDAMDAFVLIFYTAWSSHWGNPLAAIIMAAVMAVLEHLTLWSMSDIDKTRARAKTRSTFEEAKATRMNAWLRELRRLDPSRPASSRNSTGHDISGGVGFGAA